jgi:hypothetical protein
MERIMKLKLFKITLLALTVFTVSATGFAQKKPKAPLSTETPFQNDNAVEQNMKDLNLNLKLDLKNIGVRLNDISPKINLALSSLNKSMSAVNLSAKIYIELNSINDLNPDSIEPNINLEFTDRDLQNIKGAIKSIKYKSYSKSYSIDGNDKIKLSNQYGKITVNTWDKHEVKVDVQIKAEANDDGDAQKLLNGVQIRDSKEGDLVSFRTSIEPNNNNSFRMWNWGGNKKRKLEINYTVYMPSRTDLNVEDSYGAIVLPDLQGKVRISSSYGSVTAEDLSNPSNQIEGSYGNLKVGNLNGARLAYSYGNVDIAECNDLKASLSYGSFKLGKLRGAADLDLSFVSGFKISDVSDALRKLNINATYSGISLGMQGNNNFSFDITTTYGGFNYNDDKVTITEKTPADGSKHYSSTKNFKGHFGKGTAAAQVSIRSTYGSVNFE